MSDVLPLYVRQADPRLASPATSGVRGDGLPWRAALPPRAHVVVADAHSLARACIHAAVGQGAPHLSTAFGTERAFFYVGAHIPHEVVSTIERIATSLNVAARALAAWANEISEMVRVIDLPVGEYLRPELLGIVRGISRRAGDPDDLPTAAVAAFLGDVVVWSEDRIFSDTGFAPCIDVAIASEALMLVGLVEAEAADAVMLTVATGYAAAAGVRAVVRLAAKCPLLTCTVVAVLIVVLLTLPPERIENTKKAVQSTKQVAAEAGRAIAREIERAGVTRDNAMLALPVHQAPPWRTRTDIEDMAALLARRVAPMSGAEIRNHLNVQRVDANKPLTAAGIERALRAHPAFTLLPGGLWQLGRGSNDEPTVIASFALHISPLVSQAPTPA